MKPTLSRIERIAIFLTIVLCLFSPQLSARAMSMNDSAAQGTGSGNTAKPSGSEPMTFGAGKAVPPTSTDGFVVELLVGGDTQISNAYYGTLAGVIDNGNGTYTEIPGGPNVPYNFGSGPMWSVRGGKMLYRDLFVYLTFQQTYWSHNTHTIIGLGGNYYLPSIGKTPVRPYLNATFGASDNTFTGTNAQTGYAWMLGAGALYTLSSKWGVFVEADIAYESPPTGVNTNIGAPPGTISSVTDVWDVPVMIGVRYSF